jgi:hypothetical protein
MPTHVTVGLADNFPVGEVVFGGQPGSLQAAPRFPLSLVSTNDLLNWSNSFPADPIPSLAADISFGATTISLTAGQGALFPENSFEVSIDNEIIFVPVRIGDNLTLCFRGAENSTPSIHFTGANVQLLITAKSHNQVASEIVAIEQTLGQQGNHVRPSEISLAPVAAGNFTVAHGLGVIPRAVLIQMNSAGAIWFQTARYDATNLYLVASDGGLTGFAQIWA